MVEKLRLTLLSFACCNPKLAAHDKVYFERIKEALKRLHAEADIELVHATDAMMSRRYGFMSDIIPLFDKYGQAVTPALFVNQKLELYGGVPTLEKLEQVLAKHLHQS
ncbi:MAG: thioredoxin family protein [Methanomassiliicoccales archaeon]